MYVALSPLRWAIFFEPPSIRESVLSPSSAPYCLEIKNKIYNQYLRRHAKACENDVRNTQHHNVFALQISHRITVIIEDDEYEFLF